MARLQRKKSPGARKRKKGNGADLASSRSENNAVLKKAPLFSGSAKDIKKTTPSRTKAIGKTREAPGKFKSTIDKGLQFLREVKVELKKVVWPTRKQTISSTVVVIILTVLISVFLGVVDLGLTSVVGVVLK